MKITCDLDTCFLCKFCLKDWKPAIEANRKNRTVRKGMHIFKEGDQVNGIYFVYSGKVKIYKKWDEEKELILRFAQKGDIIGHLGIGGSGFYPVSATAIEEVTVCFVETAFLETTMNVNNDFVIKLMHFFASELRESEKRMRNLAHMSVKGRVAQALLSLRLQFGRDEAGVINVELSRQDLASFTGTSYESLFRTINELVRDEIIAVTGKSISIKKEDILLGLTDGITS
jgi:CRP/FNR family transcriptional regulator